MKTCSNRVVSLNGTLRERTKVTRGWKNVKTPIAEGQRIHYNFVIPHMALDGKTPAEVSGIKIEGKNKWKTIIQNASLIQRTHNLQKDYGKEEVSGGCNS